jgi:UDPglucose 6-dehydrogenase
VVVGCDHEADFKILRRVYSQFVNHVRIKYIETTPETAEAIKYVANTMLLTYISFWNGVGAKLGEKISNVNIDDLRMGVTADDRISTWGSFVSNGAGGSCFGKDIASLIYQLRRLNVNTKMLEASFEVNEYQKVYLVDRANLKSTQMTCAMHPQLKSLRPYWAKASPRSTPMIPWQMSLPSRSLTLQKTFCLKK